MAISHIQPCLLLLVTLIFIPALVRSAKFENCDVPFGGETNIVNVTSLEISPDSYNSTNPRTGTFTLTANSTENVQADKVTVYLDRTADYITYYKRYPLCNVTACPVVTGPLTLTFTDVFSAGLKTAPKISEQFVIQILENKLPNKVVMCIYFSFFP